ncbi:hypothetical protein ENBRE01_0143 [Enteropsectra breve]|nr:hypothetical protein ENBRE01_0143 [Enteropsectra breve]
MQTHTIAFTLVVKFLLNFLRLCSPYFVFMAGIFPRAIKAEIEPTIGHNRQSAHAPKNQVYRDAAAPKNSKITKTWELRPEWFLADRASGYEARIFTEPDYIETRNKILAAYGSAGRELCLSDCLGFGAFGHVLKTFDFLEDNEMINYQMGLKEAITELKALSFPAAPLPFSDAAVEPMPREFKKEEIPTQHKSGKNKVLVRYVPKSILENAQCSCGSPAQYFSAELVFICKSCFHSDSFLVKCSKDKFHKINSALLAAIWTKEDEYSLLKSIEIHGDKWTEVSAAVNKPVSHCIWHFLKMSMLDEIDYFPTMPFSSMPNQLSTLISYVCYSVHPAVAAEMAKRAIKYLSRPNLIEIIVAVSVERAKEILTVEKKKQERLGLVEIEALIRQLKYKIYAIREIYTEVKLVKAELEEARERLMEDSVRN